MFNEIILLLLVLGRNQLEGRPVRQRRSDNGDNGEVFEAAQFLLRYGYLTGNINTMASDILEASISPALRNMQEFAGLPVTGVLDVATKEQMKKPRCSHPDIYPENNRQKRFAHSLPPYRWERGRQLNVVFTNYTNDLPKHVQEGIVDYAVKVWNAAANTNLKFWFNQSYPGPARAEVNVFHTKYNHRGQVLPVSAYGQASYPKAGQILYFNTEFTWAIQDEEEPDRKMSYPHVAMHELGHSLGLRHTVRQFAIMNAYYNPLLVHPQHDDIMGVITLYGSSSNETLPPVEPELGFGPKMTAQEFFKDTVGTTTWL